MNVSVRQLKAFLAVARLRSFTRAAENLLVTQQGLSLMIQELEKQFGGRLFDRTTRRVALTAAGRQLVAVAGVAVASLEEAASSISQLSTKAAQTLSVAATPFVAATLMPEACMRFKQRHPDVAVRIIDVERWQIQSLIESEAADLGFGIFLKPAGNLHRRVIFQCEMVCLSKAAGKTPRRRKKIVRRLSWADLAETPLIGLPADNSVQELVDAHLAPIAPIDEDRLVHNNISTILSMVEAGFGNAVLPSFTVSALDRMNLDAALMEHPIVPVDFYQVNVKGKSRAAAESEFVDTLLDTLRARCTLSY